MTGPGIRTLIVAEDRLKRRLIDGEGASARDAALNGLAHTQAREIANELDVQNSDLDKLLTLQHTTVIATPPSR